MKMTNTEKHCVQISCAEFAYESAVNLERAGRNAYTVVSEV
jgi:hypothetical protein